MAGCRPRPWMSWKRRQSGAAWQWLTDRSAQSPDPSGRSARTVPALNGWDADVGGRNGEVGCWPGRPERGWSAQDGEPRASSYPLASFRGQGDCTALAHRQVGQCRSSKLCDVSGTYCQQQVSGARRVGYRVRGVEALGDESGSATGDPLGDRVPRDTGKVRLSLPGGVDIRDDNGVSQGQRLSEAVGEGRVRENRCGWNRTRTRPPRSWATPRAVRSSASISVG